MSDINAAIKYLKEKGIEAVDCSGILTIPCDGPDKIIDLVSICKRYFKEIGYEKSWQINPYYYDEYKRMKGDFDL